MEQASSTLSDVIVLIQHSLFAEAALHEETLSNATLDALDQKFQRKDHVDLSTNFCE